jgi:tRNA nucleotidyltransferase/poly(A) polymerase
LLTVGLKHGTVTVIINKHPVEITTYRIDGEYIVVGSYDISIKAILQALSEKNGKDYFSV